MLTHPVTPSETLSANIVNSASACRLLYCVQYMDDGAVTEKIVNLSAIIVMACYMVEMTPRCIMGR